MKYVRDTTGRFPQRPHYELSELDQECERIITQFMAEACGGFSLPIPTEALTKLIERDAADLDLYADLKPEGETSHVERITTAVTRKDFGFTTSLRLAPAEAEDFVLPFRPFMMSPLRNLRGHIPFRRVTPVHSRAHSARIIKADRLA